MQNPVQPQWTARTVTVTARSYLMERGVPAPRLDSELLLAHVLGCTRLQLFMDFDRPLTAAERARYREVVKLRGQRVPLQYITGSAEFMSLNFKITPAVMIPRPETEFVVEEALRCLSAWVERQGSGTGVPPVKNHGQDAHATLDIREGAYLPHWTMEGATYAVTFRLGDSLPQKVLESWLCERDNIVITAKQMGRPLSAHEEKRLQELHSEKVEKYLDEGHGACWMKNDRIASIVANALLHFDGKQYDLLTWCVMANHVHVVVKPHVGYDLPDILHSWKSFTAKEANKALGRGGEFWQEEYYDHLVRDEVDFRRCVEYVLNNPEMAGLKDWKWVGMKSGMENHGQDAHATSSGTGVPPVENHGQDAHGTVPMLADVGTGSGNIAISVAKGLAGVRVFATDISPEALQVARENAARHGVDGRITFAQGDLLEPLRGIGLEGTLAVVVSNPPYVANSEEPTLQPEVLKEPKVAVFAGDDAVAFHRRLAAAAAEMLAPGGHLVLELGIGQSRPVQALLTATGSYTGFNIQKDLAGIERVISARFRVSGFEFQVSC